ncbi:MAG: diguanylate cyclase [Cyanobacteria bacterium J06581_3]
MLRRLPLTQSSSQFPTPTDGLGYPAVGHHGYASNQASSLSNGASGVSTASLNASESFHSSGHSSDAGVLEVDQLKQQIQQQRRLLQVERKLGQTLHFSTIASTTVVETAALFNARQVSLLRYDAATNTCGLVVRYCQTQALAYQRAISITEASFPLLLAQLASGQSVQFSPAQKPSTTEAFTTETQRWLSDSPGSWLFVPIRVSPTDDTFWGVMTLCLPERETWTEDAIAAADSIIVALTSAMQHAQQYHELLVANQELQKLALSDGLTSLANRRRFDEHLADEWQRLARDRQPLSLILCDLDHFKRYNDTFGHPAGDRCLIRVARALLSGPQRPADLVARYGGEEFAIVLPNTDTHGAWRIAQKIHESIRALKVDHAPGNEEPYVTVTMGVSTVIPGHDNTPQMLVQASDLALYHAKQQGRNRTYINAHYNTVEKGRGSQRSDASLDVMPTDA